MDVGHESPNVPWMKCESLAVEKIEQLRDIQRTEEIPSSEDGRREKDDRKLIV